MSALKALSYFTTRHPRGAACPIHTKERCRPVPPGKIKSESKKTAQRSTARRSMTRHRAVPRGEQKMQPLSHVSFHTQSMT
uniref:Uncharacterized protein n=1 Tax=Romanomermis culicivorax TaxID=13658 RepID=A0A915I4D9_ROMCU